MGSKASKGQVISVPPQREQTVVVETKKQLVAEYQGIHNVKLHNVENKDCKITSATFLPNGNLLICDQANSSLKLFNRMFEFESRLKLPGQPHDLCIYSSNNEGSDVYVTLPRERIVLEIYVDGNKITHGNEFKTENWCYGITAYNEGLLITVGTKLKHIDANSKFIKNIINSKIGESPFGSPCYLEVTRDDNILISDSLKHVFYCIDGEGREMFRYNGMHHLHGAVIVDNDALCVAGRNDQSSKGSVLKQLTADGEHVKSLLTWKRVGFTPLAASYRHTDKILVLGGEINRIKTFKLRPHVLQRSRPGRQTFQASDLDSRTSHTTDSDSEPS